MWTTEMKNKTTISLRHSHNNDGRCVGSHPVLCGCGSFRCYEYRFGVQRTPWKAPFYAALASRHGGLTPSCHASDGRTDGGDGTRTPAAWKGPRTSSGHVTPGTENESTVRTRAPAG
eukprot:1375686-Prymnesium_polylepis.3